MHTRSYIIGHEGHSHYISYKNLHLLKNTFGKTNKYKDVIPILKNLSDPTKLKIYLLLHRVEEIAVSDIVYILGLSQSAVSHALTDMKKLGLVESNRCGQLICYSLKGKLKS